MPAALRRRLCLLPQNGSSTVAGTGSESWPQVGCQPVVVHSRPSVSREYAALLPRPKSSLGEVVTLQPSLHPDALLVALQRLHLPPPRSAALGADAPLRLVPARMQGLDKLPPGMWRSDAPRKSAAWRCSRPCGRWLRRHQHDHARRGWFPRWNSHLGNHESRR